MKTKSTPNLPIPLVALVYCIVPMIVAAGMIGAVAPLAA